MRYTSNSLIIILTFLFLLPQTYNVHAILVLLSDIAKPLSPEQIAELERDPQGMLNKCLSTLQDSKGHSDTLMSWDEDKLALCDNFMSHLQNKCSNFNNLLDYCGIDLILYDVERTTQLNCLENRNYSTTCKDYFSNSSGVTVPASQGKIMNESSHITEIMNTLNPSNGTESIIEEAEKLIEAADKATATVD